MQHLRPEGWDEREKQDISRSCRQRAACRGDLAATDQPRLYFLPSPWTHFLAPGLGQRKKQQPPRERKGELERMEGGRGEGRKKKKKPTAAGLGIKTGANPFCIVQHDPLPLLANSFPLGASWRDILQTLALISRTAFSKNMHRRCSKHIRSKIFSGFVDNIAY